MLLNISNTGPQINEELADYLDTNFPSIGYDQIFIYGETIDSDKTVNITHPGFQNRLRNTACIAEDNLNQNIIDWLKTL